MGRWNFKNIGASAKPENKKMVEKIFEYIGFAPKPEYAGDGEERSFDDPDVYCCMYSAYEEASGKIKDFIDNVLYVDMDLLYLLNALCPKTNIYEYSAEGNNTSDVWENHETFYDTNDMTCYRRDSYTAYGGPGPSGHRSSKSRFALKPPEEKLVRALIKLSEADRNTELTTVLTELYDKLKNKQIVYEDDDTDKRKIGEAYDVEDNVKGDEDPDEAYYDYVLKKMPFKVFNDLYKIKPSATEDDSEEIDIESDYNDMLLGELIENSEYTYHNPFDIEFKDFVELLEGYEYETELDEEAYQKAREKVAGLNIISKEEFKETGFFMNDDTLDEENDEEDYSDDEEDLSEDDDWDEDDEDNE